MDRSFQDFEQMAPQVLDEDYFKHMKLVKIRELSKTRHATVTEVDDEGTRKVVKSILIVKDEHDPSINNAKAIIRESKILQFASKNHHPFLASMESCGFHEQVYHILMPKYAKGHMAEVGAANMRLLPRFLTQAAIGLRYLHSLHIIHGDVKPWNFFIDSDNNVHLGDFGMSFYLASGTTSVHDWSGTKGYRAPELFNKEPPFDAFKLDTYAFGATAVSLFLDRRTVDKVDLAAVVDEKRDRVPRAFRHALKLILRKKPVRRRNMDGFLVFLKKTLPEEWRVMVDTL